MNVSLHLQVPPQVLRTLLDVKRGLHWANDVNVGSDRRCLTLSWAKVTTSGSDLRGKTLQVSPAVSYLPHYFQLSKIITFYQSKIEEKYWWVWSNLILYITLVSSLLFVQIQLVKYIFHLETTFVGIWAKLALNFVNLFIVFIYLSDYLKQHENT